MTRKKRGFCNWFNLVAAIWIIISEIFLHAFCLKDLKIFVPEAVITGNAATLSCQYELEQAPLYSVRWYFESEEFYRYVPKESPPSIVFPVSGITVDGSSDSTSVTLRSITRELSGKFKCEVSEDAPMFHTEIREAHMQVVELPKEEPSLQIDKKIIGINDSFKAVCTVGKSYPAANITWYINTKKVYKNPYQRVVYRTYEGSPTFSSLEVQSSSPIIQDILQAAPKFNPSIKVMCEVSILHVYHKNVEAKLGTINPSLTTVTPNLLGLEKASIGDPDNSPLTGGGGSHHHHNHNQYQPRVYHVILLIICCYYFCYDSIL
ncbi:uncharacterized protein LOC129578493 isoform X2 [Sitodiplosis mosellana]|uniref:uncharacterized protein LOC129578493 isoform X2 n=1 Tax=Sitodiplosis mosellana TaxID=263140 RepID=UPI002444922E|nr:uncharacterized protein LOC129578493 isoform X2 [Sitodiplosis mosellana]